MTKLQKQIILGAAVVLLGIFSWWFLKYIFYIGNLTVACWVSGVILLIFWGAALCLAMLLIDDKRILYSIFILTLISFIFFFNNEPFYYLIGLIILFLAFWFASKRIKREQGNQINLNFWKIWKKGLPILITALVLIIAIVYYFSPFLAKLRDLEIELPRNVFDTIIEPIEDIISDKLPIEVEVLNTDELYELANKEINEKLNPSFKRTVPIALAIGLFVGLKVVSIAYVVIVILLSWLILRLLMIIGFIKTETIQKEMKTIKL